MTEWNQQITVNETGTRCVIETSWGPGDGPRCQMIWEIQPGGGVRVSTCDPNVPEVRLNAEQRAGLAYFLRSFGSPVMEREAPPLPPAPRPPVV